MKPVFRYALLTLLWGAVAAYVGCAAVVSQRLRREQVVQRMEIDLLDSTSLGCLVSGTRVRGWIARQGIPTVGAAVGAVDLAGIEQLIARNGFVDRVEAYVTGRGTLYIDIRQRKPVVRLLIVGFDAYATAEGYLFAAPPASSLYVPVVTGGYRPPFPGSYAGNVRDHIDERLAEVGRRIEEIEREKYPLYRRELENDRRIAALRLMRISRRWWRLESAEAFDRRVEELRAYKAVQRRRYRYEARLIQEEIGRIEARQEAERARQKKLEKSYEDFMKLLTFVQKVEEDDFWRSEVVQIVARTTSSGALEVDLVPRSGGYTVRFGRVDDEEAVERRFDKLLSFYRGGLSAVGWDTYRLIDLRFDGQVVCRK